MHAGKTIRGSHASLNLHGTDEAAIAHAWARVQATFPGHFQEPLQLSSCTTNRPRSCVNILLCWGRTDDLLLGCAHQSAGWRDQNNREPANATHPKLKCELESIPSHAKDTGRCTQCDLSCVPYLLPFQSVINSYASLRTDTHTHGYVTRASFLDSTFS